MIEPRPYQADALPALYRFWKDKPGEYPLIVMPTASGKTIVFSLLIANLLQKYPGMNCLVLCHRKELISQCENKLLEVWPEAPTGVYSAALNRRETNLITIASRDTFAPALKTLDYIPRIVIVDEAHNISPKEESRYRKVIAELERRNKKLMVLGCTATPYRTGNGIIYGEGQFFHSIGYQVKMRFLLDEKFILPLRSVNVDDAAKIDTTNVAITAGEFNQKQLASEAERHETIRASVADWYDKAWSSGRKHTLFFCVSIAHAEATKKEIATYGLDMPIVTGKTKDEERDEVSRRILNRELPGIINVGVFTEGTDLPVIDCIACMRATHSLNLWMQIAGRLMRIDPESPFPDGLMLDYGQNISRFGPIDIAMPPERRGKRNTKPRTKVCPECQAIVGYFKINCIPPCEHKFAPRVSKKCDHCGELCDPRAGECPACGFIFVKHDTDASRGDMLSDANRYQSVKVTHLSTSVSVSRKTDLPYLSVTYHTERLDVAPRKVLCFGYFGAAHDRAINEWLRMTRPELDLMIPATPDQAYRIGIDWQQEHWRPVESIIIDKYSKYKSIVSVQYAPAPIPPAPEGVHHAKTN